MTARVLAAFRASREVHQARPETSLTSRELDVLRLVGRGLSNREVADQLVIGEVTVKTHLGHILSKLGCAIEPR